jgi:hypothetical protein
MKGFFGTPVPMIVPESFLSGPRVRGVSVYVPLPVARTNLTSIAIRCFVVSGAPAAPEESIAAAIPATASAAAARCQFMI